MATSRHDAERRVDNRSEVDFRLRTRPRTRRARRDSGTLTETVVVGVGSKEGHREFNDEMRLRLAGD